MLAELHQVDNGKPLQVLSKNKDIAVLWKGHRGNTVSQGWRRGGSLKVGKPVRKLLKLADET